MKTLQGKAFWRRKRAVLENQRVAIENRVEIPSEPKKTETLWSYACSGFSEIRPKIDPKSTQIEKVENRSGATPVMVSAVFCPKSSRIAYPKKSLRSYACRGFRALDASPELGKPNPPKLSNWLKI